MRYESTDWSVEVPDGWTHDVDDVCTTFEPPDRLTAVQVSSYRKDDVVTDDDLREFAGEIPLAPVLFGHLTGFRSQSSEGETVCTKWWLRAGHQMFFLTYTCPLAGDGREPVAVTAMLESLRPEYDAHKAEPSDGANRVPRWRAGLDSLS